MKFTIRFFISILCLAAMAIGCAPSRIVAPLEKGEKQVGGSFGGPMFFQFGGLLPLPLISGYYAQGISDRVTGFGAAHLTTAFYKTGHIELGAVIGITQLDSTKKWFPAFSATPVANIATSFRDGATKVWPQLDINARWNVGKKSNFLYLGANNWLELSATRAFGEPQPNALIFSPQIGFKWFKNKWNYQVESKMIAPNISNQNIVVDYFSPIPERGALGIYFSIGRRL